MGVIGSLASSLGIGSAIGGGLSGMQNQAQGLPQGVGPANYDEALKKLLLGMQTQFDPSNQARGQQQDFITALKSQIAGTAGPSIAELQQQHGLAQAQKQMAGNMASARGINPALASRNAAQANAGMAGNLLGQTGMLRAQEHAGNQNQLAQALMGMRGQDLTQAQTGQQGAAALGGLQNQQQALSANIGQKNAEFGQGILGGLVGGAGKAGMMAAMGWHGGEVNGYDAGGIVPPDTMSAGDQFIKALAESHSSHDYNKDFDMSDIQMKGKPGTSEGYNVLQESGQLGMGPTAPGSAFGTGSFTSGIPGAMGPSYQDGGYVPGESEVDGDSPRNDKVHALLSPGEIIIPRSAAKDVESAHDFIEALMKKRAAKKMNCGGKV